MVVNSQKGLSLFNGIIHNANMITSIECNILT